MEIVLNREQVSEFEPRLEGDHPGSAVAAKADAEQAGWRGHGIGQRSESGLRGWLAGNAGVHIARQSKIDVVEYIEELAFDPKLEPLAQREPFRQVKVAPEKVWTAKCVATRISELAILRAIPAVARSSAWINS